SEIYNGETVDQRRAQAGWDQPGFDDSQWAGVQIQSFDKQRLLATENEPVKAHEVFKPQRIFTSPAGETIVDFGQNLVGWVRIRVSGKACDSVVVTHAEVLTKQGNMYYDNLRGAQCRNVYIADGRGETTFHPHFSWQGFRYAAIKGYPGTLTADKLEAVALYSDMEPTGSFSTSHPLVNQLQHNIQWGQRGNFLDVPTDCPQRDERLGWTGDAQAFSRTAAFNFNVLPFFSKWLQDVEADQVNGAVPWVVPNVLNARDANSSGWSDVATIVPWNMYLAYGDTALLERQYASMKAYVESIRAVAKDNLWNSGWHFGDWLFFRPFDDNDGRSAVTDKFMIAQCFYAHSAELVAKAARVLGKAAEASAYQQLAETVKEAYRREYMTPTGRLVSSTQTAYVLALQFDMLPPALRQQAAARLAENVESYGHISTGFLGTPYICHVLSKYGYHHLAVKLLLREQYPSWLYPVKMGATTIWERWDGMKPDSSFQTPGMNSFNHYAYGAIGDWLYRVVAGIDTDESAPGYRQVLVKPHPVKELGTVQASLMTPFGKVSSRWQPEEKQTQFEVVIPPNTSASIQIPASAVAQVTEGGKPLASVFPAGSVELKDGRVCVSTGSGTYRFTIVQE
ncbi:MAG: glycoside hydrolase family 78 protein, partial [Chitinophagaceae bacterium]|nr:glycoside hydrolase family 78 protein [Chitinophagaceae bacterium]